MAIPRDFKSSSAVSMLALVMLSFSSGCHDGSEVQLSTVLEAEQVPDERVRERLDGVLQATFERDLNLEDHAAWQILHGTLVYGRDFQVGRHQTGKFLRVVDYLLGGGRLQGWTTEPGVLIDEATDRRGLHVAVEPGSKSGQGHHDQWFAVLAQAGLDPDATIKAGGHSFTMEDWVSQVKWDLPRNLEREFSWTLIGLTAYLPTDAEWPAQDGQTWGIARLLEYELEHELELSACGGSHRLIGMSMALNQHLAQGGARSGVWEAADNRVQAAIEIARQFQNQDGSFSVNYFQRPGASPDLAEDLGATGHTLEFIALAANDQQLREPWIQKAVLHLCGLLSTTAELPIECGALYHAAHGLMLYRQRLFGEFIPTPRSPEVGGRFQTAAERKAVDNTGGGSRPDQAAARFWPR